MHYFGLNPVEKKNQDYYEVLKKYILDFGSQAENPPHPIVGEAMSSLWKDESINKLMKHHPVGFYLCDSAP